MMRGTAIVFHFIAAMTAFSLAGQSGTPAPAPDLQSALAKLQAGDAAGAPERLREIPGVVPSLVDLPAGCTFAPRCAFADQQCRAAYPPYEEKRGSHWAACWHADAIHGAVRGYHG